VSQPFGSYATGGVAADPTGTEVQQLVAQYGNYQPYGHAGQDIACPIGTPVHAIAAGTVLWADWGTNLPGDDSWGPSGYFARWALYKTFPGIVTVIQHGGWISVYAHLSEAPLNPGDVVAEGQQIALSGNTRSPGVSLGAHLHVEALVDLSYSTGNGLIYGRTDPTPYFGTISAQSATIAPEGLFMSLTPEEEQRILAAADRINGTVSDVKVLNASDGAYMNSTRDAQHASVMGALNTLFTKADGAWQNGVLANLPAQVLNQSFTLPDGTKTNLAGILSAIHAKPAAVAGAPAAVDVEALVARLKAELPAAVLAELTAKLTK
jgi:hypothetical protein